MTIFCRLCAESKDSSEIITSINDSERLVQEKLIACCQWDVELTETNLPEEVCECCLDKLEKSWLFSQSVELAQRKLLEIFENDAETKSVPNDFDPRTAFDYNSDSNNCIPNLQSSVKCELNDDGVDECPEQIFVEAITLPGTATECEEHLINQETETKLQKRYECDLCQKRFTTSNKLKMHKLVHSDERPFSCPKCEKRFKSMKGINQHLRHVHKEDASNETEAASYERKPEELKYACNHCDRRFRKKWDWSSHQISHSSDRPYECWMCHAALKTRNALRGHMKLHTENPPIECDICHKGFRTNFNFRLHLKNQHGIQGPERGIKPTVSTKPPDRNFTCELCGRNFTRSSLLKTHMMTTHSDLRPYECNICGQGFKIKLGLRHHLITHTEYQYKCNQCEKTFRKKISLQRHLEYHTASTVKPFVCDCCGRVFRLNIDLVEHQQIHTKKGEDFKYACDHCERRFTSKWNLSIHQISHSTDRPYECWMCHTALKDKRGLKRHMKLHTENPSIECDICHKGFRTQFNFRLHLKNQHGILNPKRERKPKAPPKPPDRRFTCELCGKSFTQSINFKAHMVTTHSDLRPHKCDICGLGFKLKNILRKHLQIHTDFQYKCNQCEKTFRQKVSLRKHLEYHTGSIVKPFVCDCCGKAFRLNVNLVEHRRIHTGEKPYSCEHCASNFRTMSSYYGHLKKEHGISAFARKREEQLRATAMS